MSSSAPTAATSAPWWPTGWPWSIPSGWWGSTSPAPPTPISGLGRRRSPRPSRPCCRPGPAGTRSRAAMCTCSGPAPDSGLRAGRLPVGLAAWIVEKWRAWSDCDGQVERRFTKDQLLTTVMLYWVTGTIGSSFRFHRDWALGAASPPEALAEALADRDAVPLGWWRRCAGASASRSRLQWRCSTIPAREWAERVYGDLRRFTDMARGGHFTAMEEPELLAQDLRGFFRTPALTRHRLVTWTLPDLLRQRSHDQDRGLLTLSCATRLLLPCCAGSTARATPRSHRGHSHRPPAALVMGHRPAASSASWRPPRRVSTGRDHRWKWLEGASPDARP